MGILSDGIARDWENFKRAIMPESTAEAAVSDMMATEASEVWEPKSRGYDPEDFSSPHVYTQAKGAVQEGLKTLGFSAVTIALLVVAVYALTPLLIRLLLRR